MSSGNFGQLVGFIFWTEFAYLVFITYNSQNLRLNFDLFLPQNAKNLLRNSLKPTLARVKPRSWLFDLIIISFFYNIFVRLLMMQAFRLGQSVFMLTYAALIVVKVAWPYLSLLSDVLLDLTLAQLISICLYQRLSVQSLLSCMPVVLLMTVMPLLLDLKWKRVQGVRVKMVDLLGVHDVCLMVVVLQITVAVVFGLDMLTRDKGHLLNLVYLVWWTNQSLNNMMTDKTQSPAEIKKSTAITIILYLIHLR